MFVPTPHPVLRLPGPDELPALGQDGWLALMKRREAIIRRERMDPLRYGWEPPVWRVFAALLGFAWVDMEWGRRMRMAVLKTETPLDVLLINGGNRGGKSEFAAKCVNRVLLHEAYQAGGKPARAWCFHTSNQMSVEYQQPLGFKFLPPELRHKIKTDVGYISYNQKYGFSDNKFVLPNGAECSYRNYEQDMMTIEGGEANIVWGDENMPPDWVETLLLRLATREGKLIVTYTPVRGYAGVVKMFLDGATPLRERVGFLCPRDGLPPLRDKALALEDCEEWAEDGLCGPGRMNGRVTVDGAQRWFVTVPRLMRCVRAKHAVGFFHSSDNPYGNPASVLERVEGQSQAYVLERFYGVASKTVSARFPKFKLGVHTLAAAAIPKKGTDYMLMDPADGRNAFMLWIRVCGGRKGEKRYYVRREWPGNYAIPGLGVPGPWALPDGKHPDGRKGPAQDPMGLGLLAYKREIARLEGWKAATLGGEIAQWREDDGADERIAGRYIDSRAASSPKIENDRPVTLQEKFAEIGLHFDLTPGDDIEEGVTLLNDLMDYDEAGEAKGDGAPLLMVCEDCWNVIFSLQTWTGADKGKGACKDPVDLLRYAVLLGLDDVGEADWKSEGGGFW
jgi:phage terminase large subunit-like protein